MNLKYPSKNPNIYDFEQKTNLLNPTYMETVQRNTITEHMRTVVVDWLMYVYYKFKYNPETMFLTTYVLDRFLGMTPVSMNQLQLVGAACFFIASKYEELMASEAKDLEYLSNRAFTKADLLEAEGQILMQLDFDVTFASSFSFLLALKENLQLGSEVFLTAQILLEISLLDYKLIRYTQAHLAVSALYVAFVLNNGRRIWCQCNIEAATGYSEAVILPCANDILNLFLSVCKTPEEKLVVKRKYQGHPVFSFMQRAAFSLSSSEEPASFMQSQ